MRKIPDICDYDCPQADFPPADTAGICRTMAAVWCRKLRELVNKNTPCEWKRRNQAATPARTPPAVRPRSRSRSRAKRSG